MESINKTKPAAIYDTLSESEKLNLRLNRFHNGANVNTIESVQVCFIFIFSFLLLAFGRRKIKKARETKKIWYC